MVGELILSDKVFSWYGAVRESDDWKPCWLSLTDKGWLRWYEFKGGHLNGVARLQAMYKHISLEPRAEYNSEEADVTDASFEQDLSNLCSTVVVMRMRVGNMEERVSFAVENKQTLEKWLNAFVKILSNGKTDHLKSCVDEWSNFQQSMAGIKLPDDVDLTACCGVPDEVLDAIIKEDLATSTRKQMAPRQKSGVGNDDSCFDTNEAPKQIPPDNTYVDMMAAGYPI